MNNSKIWLSSPHMGSNEQNYVNEAFETNWVAPLGPNVNGFEKDLETYLGNNSYVGALSSGTAAIHLGLILLGVQAGDAVICQSMTFSASANPILYLGATPVIPILEDSAEALGSRYKGQQCGTFGDIGILSFNGNKIITTSGGGALISNNKEVKDKAIFLATQARDDAPHYQHSEVGYNYRMSNICAGIGRGQMEVLDKHITLRRKMNDFYKELFQNTEGITVFENPNEDYQSNHWLTAIVMDSEKTNSITAENIRQALEKENIESRPLWKPMHLQPIFEKYPYYGQKVAENLFENGLCLPSGSNLTEKDRERIRKALAVVVKM